MKEHKIGFSLKKGQNDPNRTRGFKRAISFLVCEKERKKLLITLTKNLLSGIKSIVSNEMFMDINNISNDQI